MFMSPLLLVTSPSLGLCPLSGARRH
jgi:hypothetical protein